MNKTHKLGFAVLVAATTAGALVVARTNDQRASGLKMADAARTFLKAISDEQRAQATFAYDDPERLNWHYIPRPRKGVPLKVLTPAARAAAHAFIASGLSDRGYEQAVNVMSLEDTLFLLEEGNWAERRQRRDPLNYYLSIFGTPSERGTWGWRVEGHHLSLNFTISDGRVIASTPEFFGANPALVDAGPGRSIRVLSKEEDLAREIVRTCTPEQMKVAIAGRKPPGDIWNTNRQQPVLEAAVGLAGSQMTADQQTLLKQLLGEYLKNMPSEVRAEREERINAAGGIAKIRIAWWGSLERNEKHAYRLQGPSFLIEYNNTQNNANHLHTVWRSTGGDLNRAIDKG